MRFPSSIGSIRIGLGRAARDARGQVLIIVALALPVLMGSAAIAVDVGYVYLVRSAVQNAADAGSRAGTAILGNGGTEAEAAAEATSFANQNIASASYLSGATPTVTFPSADSVKVAISHTLPLFFAPIIGINASTVSVNATAALAAVNSVPSGNVVPLAIYCNNPSGCSASLSVSQQLSGILRQCGNFFGASGSTCNYNSNVPSADSQNGEIFLTGLSFNNNNSTGELKDDIENGYSGTTTIGQVASALPGTKQGWQNSMTQRLNSGDNEMTFVVVEPYGDSAGDVRVVDFIQVRITNFNPGSASAQDEFDIEIIQKSFPSTDYVAAGEGLGISSTTGVRLIN